MDLNGNIKINNMTIEQAKALFFAQFLGQKVYCRGTNNYLGDPINELDLEVQFFNFNQYERHFLLLRTVNQLTDGEKSIVAELCSIDVGYAKETGLYIDPYFSVDENYIEINVTMGDDSYYPIAHSAYQFLLRIGILLPFTYLDDNNQPVTLPEDEIISLGWAKVELQEGKK